jgi:hypothetical protein
MVVAIFVIGVILSAMGSVLISVMRSIVTQEREAIATALAQQEVERLLTLDWDAAGHYANEIPEDESPWHDYLAQEAPGGDLELLPEYLTDDERLAQVPRPVSPFDEDDERLVINGTEFTIYRFVTWLDRSSPAGGATVNEDTKRFTTVVEWDAMGRTRSISARGERIPTPGEAGATDLGIRVLSYFRSPDPALLDSDGHTEKDIVLDVRLNRGVLAATVTFQRAEVATVVTDTEDEAGNPVVTSEDVVTFHEVERDMVAVPASLSPDGYSRWRLTIASGEYRFVDGVNPFEFRTQDFWGEELSVVGSIRFQGSGTEGSYPGGTGLPEGSGGDGDGEGTLAPVELSSAGLSSPFCVSTSTWELTNTVKVTAQVKGLSSADTVTASYQYQTDKTAGNQTPVFRTATETLTFRNGNETQATFDLELQRNAGYRWEPGSTIQVWVYADRASDEDNDARWTNTVTVGAGC